MIHCLRGPDANKAIAIRNIAAVLGTDGVLFGGTVLGLNAHHTWSARAALKLFNKEGGFDNLGDTADGLRTMLDESFQAVQVDVVGSAALFTATGPRSASPA